MSGAETPARSSAASSKARLNKHFVVLGDFNDDPYDGPADNSYVGTFLDQQPAYHFLTQQLPPDSVTSTGFYHYVNGKKITGEFLDHVIATGEWVNNFTTATPKIFSVPESGYVAWEKDYSDSLPGDRHLHALRQLYPSAGKARLRCEQHLREEVNR